MTRGLARYLSFGILYVGVQEFWVSVLWRGDIVAFILAVIITEGVFLTSTFYLWKIVDKALAAPGFADLVGYVVFGALGLVTIEWYFAGNLPGRTEANQFVMFTTWGGSALFARLFTDESADTGKVRKYALRFFLMFAGSATALGLLLLLVDPQLTFAVTYIAAIFGYPLMNIFFFWHFVGQIRTKRFADLK